MSPRTSNWNAIKAVFDAALPLPPAERVTLVQKAGLDDASLAELQSLLQHHDEATGQAHFLTSPGQAEPQPATAHAGQRLGAWQIVRPVGAGGMGEVFEARRADGQYDGRAAVKLLKRGMDSAAVLQRFAQERQALARLNHPHIARLLDAGASDDGLPYFVLEYVDGQPIDEAVRGAPLEARLRLFLQLAEAVAHAHRNLLVHRDLKPGNVLVDVDGNVKLLDFGIAKALDPLEHHDGNTTVGGVRPYTPNYASPEQVRGEPVTTATDIYSLGVLLYQMLTGTRPTGRNATTPAEAARSVLEDEPTRPSRLTAEQALDPQWSATRKRLEGDLDNILLKALEKTVERRYASVDALAADVQHVLAGRPVSARPASAAYVLGKFVRRNRWAVLAGGLGGLGLASGLAAALLEERVAAALGVLGLAGGLGLALLKGRQAAVSRDLAQSRLVETRAIVSDVMVRHADAIHFLPGGLNLKAELLENMIGHLDRLAAQAGGDSAFAGEVAQAYARLADLQSANNLLTQNKVDASDTNATKALALFGGGASAHAGKPEYLMWWARAWRTRAFAARNRGDMDTALRCMQEMAAVAQAALGKHPGNDELLSELGSAYFGIGQMHHTWNQPHLRKADAALAAFAKAEAIYQRQFDDQRPAVDMAVCRHQLGTIAGARMMVCWDRGHAEEAVAHGRRAVAIRQANCAGNPGHMAFRVGLGTECNNLSFVLLESGDAAGALEMAELMQRVNVALEQDDPGAHTHMRLRGQLHLGRALMGVGRAAEALPLLLGLAQAPWPAGLGGGAQRLAWTQLELARAQHTLGDREAAWVSAQSAHAALKNLCDSANASAETWLLRARTEALLHSLAEPGHRERWRAAHAVSAQTVRAFGPVLPWNERWLAPVTPSTH